jgi:hypothetical protein
VVSVRWATAEAEAEGTDWADLGDKLKAPAAKKDAAAVALKLRVLDRLGADGWEVYAQAGSDATANYATWSLKRRLP